MSNWLYRLLGWDTPNISQDAYGDAVAMSLLRDGNVKKLKQLFSGIQGDWSRRYFYSLAMSRSFPSDKLEKWVRAEPESADAHLVYGARMLKLAWAARGYGKGGEVSEERWQNFYRLLEQTESMLLRAASLNKHDPTPWVYLIMVAVYRSDDESLEEKYFNEAIARDRENWHAHINRLTALSEKYGGSHEEMFEFARRAAEKSPETSLLRCLILKAHSEYWKYVQYFEDDVEHANAYRLREDVIEECLQAYEGALAQCEGGSHDLIFVRINAAGTFWILSQQQPLRRELQKLSGQIDDIHWRWVGTEGELAAARKFALS
ncbi:MAG TPA: DUF4034 domain-containing protein [Gallionellaceae bacterium]